jgi:hypothetical protein
VHNRPAAGLRGPTVPDEPVFITHHLAPISLIAAQAEIPAKPPYVSRRSKPGSQTFDEKTRYRSISATTNFKLIRMIKLRKLFKILSLSP